MPRKIRQLIRELEKAGFVDRGGKGSHRNFTHVNGQRVTISGKPGDDAKHYQERKVRDEIAASQQENTPDEPKKRDGGKDREKEA